MPKQGSFQYMVSPMVQSLYANSGDEGKKGYVPGLPSPDGESFESSCFEPERQNKTTASSPRNEDDRSSTDVPPAGQITTVVADEPTRADHVRSRQEWQRDYAGRCAQLRESIDSLEQKVQDFGDRIEELKAVHAKHRTTTHSIVRVLEMINRCSGRLKEAEDGLRRLLSDHEFKEMTDRWKDDTRSIVGDRFRELAGRDPRSGEADKYYRTIFHALQNEMLKRRKVPFFASAPRAENVEEARRQVGDMQEAWNELAAVVGADFHKAGNVREKVLSRVVADSCRQRANSLENWNRAVQTYLDRLKGDSKELSELRRKLSKLCGETSILIDNLEN